MEFIYKFGAPTSMTSSFGGIFLLFLATLADLYSDQQGCGLLLEFHLLQHKPLGTNVNYYSVWLPYLRAVDYELFSCFWLFFSAFKLPFIFVYNCY